MRSTWLERHYAPYSEPVAPLFHVEARQPRVYGDVRQFLGMAQHFANANARLRLDKGTVAMIAAHLGWSIQRAEQAADEADRVGALQWIGEALMSGVPEHGDAFEADGRWF